MLSRAVLPLLRQRSIAIPARTAFASSQIRLYAKSRKTDDYNIPESAQVPDWQTSGRGSRSSRYEDGAPLRPVTVKPTERIAPQPAERTSTLGSPVAAPNPVETSSLPKRNDPNWKARTTPQAKAAAPAQHTQRVESTEYVNPAEPEIEQQPLRPLPDLTKGIPSTLADELGKAQKGQVPVEDKTNITEDPKSPPPGPGGRRGGELPKSAYVSSSDRRRSTAVKVLFLVWTIGTTSYLLYMGRNWESEEEAAKHKEAPNGYSPGATYARIRARLGTTVSYYSDPIAAKLLPDEPADPSQRAPFVLVLSLEDLLVHSEWSRQHGYRIAKRPGFDYFVRYLSPYYELVLFTSQPSFFGDQVLRKLDPLGLLIPLYREHTLYSDGGYVKDLSYLNRDLKKVVIIDTDAHHVKNQPENAIILPKWNGDPNDQTLIQFIPFLEYLATMGFDDARTVLQSFEGKYIPAEFARREKLLREKFEKEQAKSRSGKGMGFGSLFGVKQPPQGSSGTGQGGVGENMMIWDQFRAEGQKRYENFNKHLEEEGPKLLAARAEMEKQAQEEAMQNMKSGLSGWFGSNASPPQQNK